MQGSRLPDNMQPRVQAGRSSAWRGVDEFDRSAPTPGHGSIMISGLIGDILDTQNLDEVRKVGKAEACIKEIILRMGSPTVIKPLIDFLMEIEAAKQWISKGKAFEPHNYLGTLCRPAMRSEDCCGPEILRHRASPHFNGNCEAFDSWLIELLSSLTAPEDNPAVRFIRDVHISLRTILLCCA